jgi:hypothetical protein
VDHAPGVPKRAPDTQERPVEAALLSHADRRAVIDRW